MSRMRSILGLDKYDSEKKTSGSTSAKSPVNTEPSDGTESSGTGNSFVKRWGLPIASVAVLAVTFGVTSASNSSHDSTLKSQQDQITSLKSQIDVQNLERQAKADKINSQVAGLSTERQDGDNAAIQDLMSKATTWATYQEYMNSRKEIQKKYHLDEKSSFMTSFMPKVGNIQDGSGTNYNEIDTNGLNMRLKAFSSSVTKVAGLKYTYVGLAAIDVENQGNHGTSTTYSVVEYTTNAAHELSDIKAYSVTQAPVVQGTMKASTST